MWQTRPSCILQLTLDHLPRRGMVKRDSSMDHKLGVYSTYVTGSEKAEQCLSLFGRMVVFFFCLPVEYFSHQHALSFIQTHTHTQKGFESFSFCPEDFPITGKKKKLQHGKIISFSAFMIYKNGEGEEALRCHRSPLLVEQASLCHPCSQP